IDVLILLPILVGVVSVLCAFFIVAIVFFFVGAVVLTTGPLAGNAMAIAAQMLAGLGLMAANIAGGAVLTLISIGLINALIWYGRHPSAPLPPTSHHTHQPRQTRPPLDRSPQPSKQQERTPHRSILLIIIS